MNRRSVLKGLALLLAAPAAVIKVVAENQVPVGVHYPTGQVYCYYLGVKVDPNGYSITFNGTDKWKAVGGTFKLPDDWKGLAS
jgi:hypothetical protein